MRKLTYLAVLEESKDGFSVYFPDLDGCISFGKTIEEDANNASEALELHIYGIEKDGDNLPVPSSIIDKNLGIIVPIKVYPELVKHEMQNKRVKTNVTIPLWLKEKAEAEGVNYSRLLEFALYDILAIKEK